MLKIKNICLNLKYISVRITKSGVDILILKGSKFIDPVLGVSSWLDKSYVLLES